MLVLPAQMAAPAAAAAAAADPAPVTGVKRKAVSVSGGIAAAAAADADTQCVSRMLCISIARAADWLKGRANPANTNTNELIAWINLSAAVDLEHKEAAKSGVVPRCCDPSDGAQRMACFVEASIAWYGLVLSDAGAPNRFQISCDTRRFCVARAMLPYISREQLEAGEEAFEFNEGGFPVRCSSASLLALIWNSQTPLNLFQAVVSKVSVRHINHIGALVHAINSYRVDLVGVLLNTIDEALPREGQLEVNNTALEYAYGCLRGGRVQSIDSLSYFERPGAILRMVREKNTRLNQASAKRLNDALVAHMPLLLPVLLPIIHAYAVELVEL